MTSEEMFGAYASCLEIEYQQKSNQCKMLKDEILKTTEIMSLFEIRKLKQAKETVKMYVLKPLESIEDSLLYANEWNQKTREKLKTKANKCQNKEYVTSVQDVLDKYIVKFDYTLETAFDTLASEKERVFNYLGISQVNEV